MSDLRFKKVTTALRREFPNSGSVKLALGLSEAQGSGATIVVFQESEIPLILPNTRQTRTIGVRLVSVAAEMTDAMNNMKRAVRALERDPLIRVFDRSGMETEVDEELPAPEGMSLATQRIDLR